MFRRSQALVLDLAGLVTGGIVGARAQFLAEKDIGNLVCSERRRQPVLVELGVASSLHKFAIIDVDTAQGQ